MKIEYIVGSLLMLFVILFAKYYSEEVNSTQQRQYYCELTFIAKDANKFYSENGFYDVKKINQNLIEIDTFLCGRENKIKNGMIVNSWGKFINYYQFSDNQIMFVSEISGLPSPAGVVIKEGKFVYYFGGRGKNKYIVHK